MALFRSKKNTDAKPEVSRGDTFGDSKGVTSIQSLSHVLKNPRITEKATMHSDAGVYTFDVSVDATKRAVAQAVALVYKVTPRKVAIVQIPAKERRSMRTGKRGVARGGKKAYVYLKKGETITIS